MTTTSYAPADDAAQWDRLAARSRRRKTFSTSGLYTFLVLASLPILIPYFWMLTIAISATRGTTETFVLWRAVVILSIATIAFFLLRSLTTNKKTFWVGAIAIVATALVALAITVGTAVHIGNFGFLWNPNMVEDLRGYAGATLQQFPWVWVAFKNSLIFALSLTVVVVITATMAGYYISRFSFYGRSGFLRTLLALHAFPTLTLIVPIFLILRTLGWLDSILAVAMVRMSLELPFSIFIMKGFFDGVPWEIEMSAMTDGASRRTAFFWVVLPQVTGGMIAIAVFAFIRGWEEYIFVFTMIFEKSNWVMSLYLFFVADDIMGTDYGIVAAVAVLYVSVPFIMYIFLQKYLLQMTIGGIKG